MGQNRLSIGNANIRGFPDTLNRVKTEGLLLKGSDNPQERRQSLPQNRTPYVVFEKIPQHLRRTLLEATIFLPKWRLRTLKLVLGT